MATRKHTAPAEAHLKSAPSIPADDVGAFHETEQRKTLIEASNLLETGISMLSVLMRSLDDDTAQERAMLAVVVERLEKTAHLSDMAALVDAPGYQPEAQS